LKTNFASGIVMVVVLMSFNDDKIKKSVYLAEVLVNTVCIATYKIHTQKSPAKYENQKLQVNDVVYTVIKIYFNLK